MVKPLLVRKEVKRMSFEDAYNLCKNNFFHTIKNYRFIEYDDAMQIASIGFYIAYQKYDINLGYEFTTFSARCIDRYFLNYYTRKNSQKRNTDDFEFVSLEDSYHFIDGTLVKDVIPYPIDNYKQVLDRIIIENAMTVLNENQKDLIIKHYFKDMRIIDIAKNKKSVVPTLIKRRNASLEKMRKNIAS